jgi:hypothetical protein
MTSTIPHPLAPSTTRQRAGMLTGLGFVLCVLVGNTLTEGGAPTGPLGRLETLAQSTSAQLGLVVELAGFVLLLCFVAQIGFRCRPGVGGTTALVAGAVALAVKLGSASATLGAVRERDRLDDATAAALLAVNDAAFVLFMIGFGVFLAAAAVSLPVGRGWAWSGALLGTLTCAVGVVGAVFPAAAVPVPFLLGLLWTAAIAVRLTLQPDSMWEGAPERIEA